MDKGKNDIAVIILKGFSNEKGFRCETEAFNLPTEQSLMFILAGALLTGANGFIKTHDCNNPKCRLSDHALRLSFKINDWLEEVKKIEKEHDQEPRD